MPAQQQEPIPFVNGQQSGFEQLGGASPIAMNVVVRGNVVQRRPGVGFYSGAPTATPVGSGPIEALLMTQAGKLYVVSGDSPNRKLYRVTSAGGADLSTAPESDIRGTARVQMVETESILAMAGGDLMQKMVLATEASSRLGNAPEGTLLAFHGYRLLTNDPDVQTQVSYSGLASGPDDFSGFETWGTGVGTAGFIQANAKPSSVVAIAENSNEVFVWTERGLQVFAPDALSDYAPSASKEIGCSARYSVIKMDEEFAWIDHLRRIVVGDGRTVAPISMGIQQALNDMATISDCFGYRYIQGDIDVLVWTFPSDGRIFVYQKGAGWGQWSRPDFGGLPIGDITGHHFSVTDGKHLVGTANGYIFELSTRNTTDAGAPINAYVQTGFLDRGSSNRKTCKCVRVTLKRGQTSSETGPVALLSWRDDLGAFGAPIEISLGDPGETYPVVEFYGLGVYRRRQWKFTFSGTDDIQLVSAVEDFVVQGN